VLHSLEPEDWTAIEVRTRSKKEAANRAFEAFRRDWFAAVASETRNLAKLARTGDAKDLRMLFAAVGYAPCPEDAHPGGRDK
jgi:hypothetical protein